MNHGGAVTAVLRRLPHWQGTQPARHGARRTAWAAAASLALLISGGVVAAPVSAAPRAVDTAPAIGPLAATGRMSSFDAQMVSLVNGARTAAGVAPVHQSSGLTQLALWWSTRMAEGATDYQLEHNPNAWAMLADYGAASRTAWAENVAEFSAAASAQAVFDAYMNSPGHRANIHNDAYRYIGVGTVAGSKGAFNTMEFTDRVDGAAAADPDPTTRKPAPTTHEPPPTAHRSAPPTHHPDPTTHEPSPSTQHKAAPTTRAHAPATHAPPPATHQPAPSHHAPEPTAHEPAQTANSGGNTAGSDAEREADKPEQYRPEPQHGTLIASFGALGLPGMTFAIRDAHCRNTVTTATTHRAGHARVTALPGTYCAVAVSAPHGVVLPQRQTFTVTAGQSFTLAWHHLSAVPVRWRARGMDLMWPV